MQEQLRSSCAQRTFTEICVVFATCLLLPAGVIRARGRFAQTLFWCSLDSSSMLSSGEYHWSSCGRFPATECAFQRIHLCLPSGKGLCSVSAANVLVVPWQFDMPNV